MPATTLDCVADARTDNNTPDNNYGASTTLAATAKWFGQTWVGLFKFDLSSIPAGATITSAKLRLYGWTYYATTNQNYACARLLREWGEGTKDSAAADIGEVTANSAKHNQVAWTWQNALHEGSDRAAFQSNTPVYGSAQWWEFDATDIVQDWVDGSDNHGLLLCGQGNTEDHLFFIHSRENETNQPDLYVAFSAGAPGAVAFAMLQNAGGL